MHVVYVSAEFVTEKKGGGLASYLANISRIMQAHGHEVTVVTLSDQNNDGILWEQGVRVERVLERHQSVLAPLRAYLWSRDLRERILAVHRKHPIDLIQYASYLGIGLCRVPRIPSVVRISSDPVYWRMLKFYDCTDEDLEHAALTERLEFLAEQRIGHIMGPSRACGEIITHRTGRPVEVIESPFYLSPDEGDPELYESRLQGKKYYLSHSSMSCLKGTHTIAEAIPRILENDPEAYLVFAGADHQIQYKNGQSIPCVDYLRQQAGEYQDRVIYLGTIRRDQLRPIIAGAYACLMPSRMDNMPNTCIEAMALGKIVIGTNGASYEQLITDGMSGYLIDKDRPDQLADKVQCLNSLTPQEYQEMCERARVTAQRFEPERAYNNLMQYYQSILSAS